ncbi:MAG TPA: quinolinate synthase [Bacteroidales bacterium]|nr:MAG: quinolinate synthase [Bacteroidetes bacterium GWE2_42_24]OFY27339.1 MAG: quinolinate synthase [Bacteroidetes bacterium GWF2_43_11]HAQ65037.1 quinolinate synthase [Bacteroidales bacterium]HBZ65913.1 quinolinate synthase [Bacteroidales bacterium]
MEQTLNLKQAILDLKQKKNAIILAHYYQIPEIQDLADFIGDSLALSQRASQVDNDVIVFCGVHFMAETAKILNPEKLVLLPDSAAGCSLADSAPVNDFAAFKRHYPDHVVITYINSTADVKVLSDVICTSGNAVQIVESYPRDQKIIFAPDRNMGAWINKITGREMVLWNGACHVHDMLTTEAILKLRLQHPDAAVVAHPECNAAVLKLADYIGSTNGMLKFVKSDPHQKFIVASETGILHQMHKDAPEKQFLVVSANETCSCNDCPYMKLNTLEKLYKCLLNEAPSIELDDEIIEKAAIPINRMLAVSRSAGLI